MQTTHDDATSSLALQYDAQGEAVRELQQHLRELDYRDMDGPVSADGRFGDRTRRAVEAFQYDYGLTVDGIAGPKTWRALRHALRQRAWQKARS